MNTLTTPVVLVVFNRPDTTRRVFAEIRRARPSTLLVIADGPRQDRQGEPERCAEVRRIVTTIDWPCTLHTNFSETNLGCHRRIVSGYDWAFSLVEEAILLEDDTLPDPSFFPFCQELLDRYRDNCQIAAVTGTNYVSDNTAGIAESYHMSLLGSVWGWATWRSRWLQYDRRLAHWPTLRSSRALDAIWNSAKAVAWWTRIFDKCAEQGEMASWDYRWAYTNFFQHRLTIVPGINLVENLGFGSGATHTANPDRRRMPRRRAMAFPLNHPQAIIWNRRFDDIFHRKQYSTLWMRVRNRIKRLLASQTWRLGPLSPNQGSRELS